MGKRAHRQRTADRRRNRRQRQRQEREARRRAVSARNSGRARPLESRPRSTEQSGGARRRRGRYGNPSVALGTFIDIDETEQFDLFQINATDFWALDEEVLGNRAAARAVLEDIDDIIGRVEREFQTVSGCGELLRRCLLEWARHSAGDPEWARSAREQWAGLFYESREPGRRLRPSLIDRLLWFRSVAVEGARHPGFRVQRLMDAGAQDNEGGHAPGDVHLRAAQALLDDLAMAPRRDGGVHPLVRLSELGDRVGRLEVTRALAAIFSSESRDMIVILHPSRYPSADFVGIQPPPRRARGPWLTYTLVIAPLHPAAPAGIQLSTPGGAGPAEPPARATPRAPAPGAAHGASPVPALHVLAPRVTFAAPVAIFPGASIWDAPSVTPDQWLAEMKMVASRGERLQRPPLPGYRRSAAFQALRGLLLEDGESRTAFVQVAWRGKPRGLPLLAALLRDGELRPEYDTDASYLEAELEPYARRGGAPRSGPATWKLPQGWTVERLVKGGVLRYAAFAG